MNWLNEKYKMILKLFFNLEATMHVWMDPVVNRKIQVWVDNLFLLPGDS